MTPLPGLHVKKRDAARDAVLAFDKVNTAPTTSGTTYAMLWVDSSGNLTFGYNGSNVIVGAAGSGGQTWDSIFSTDKTLAMTGDTFTMTQGSNVAGLTLAKSATGAGTVLAITNSGTGKDITGPSWSIVSTGSVGILELTSAGTINATDGALSIGKTATATTFKGTVTFDEALTMTGSATMGASATLTLTGTADTNVITLTAGDIVVSNGKLAITNDDTDTLLALTGNSVTTGSMVSITGNGVTSGDMVLLTTTDAGFSGKYLRVTDGSDIFSIGDEGVTVIAGTDGTTSLTLTAGDAIFSEGSLAITDTDDAASLSVTNNTATTASVIVVAGSGTFTGNTTSAFATLTASGLTSGTVLYVPAAALTTGKVLDVVAAAQTDGILATLTGGAANLTATGRLLKLAMGAATVGQALEISTTGAYTGAGVVTITADSATTAGVTTGQGVVAISADGLTTGAVLDITSTSAVLTSGELVNFEHVASSATLSAKTGQLVDLTCTRTNTALAGTVADDFDALSLIRSSTQNGAGGTLTATGAVLYVENQATQTAGTLTDSVNGVEVVMDADGTGDGLKVTHSAVTGKAINVVSSGTTATGVVLVTANSLTSGQVVKIASSATASTSVGRLLLVDHSGATSTSGVLSEFASAANDETVILRVTASDLLAAGNVLDLSAAAMTTGTALDIGNLDALTTGKGVNIVSNSANTGAFILQQITNDNALATGALCLGLQQDSTGDTMLIDHNGITGKALFIDHEGTTQTGGVVDISAAVLTTGTVVDIGDADALTTGKILNLVSNSSDTGTRTLVQVTNDHASASGVTCLQLKNDNATSTNYTRMMSFVNSAGTTVTIWVGSGTTPSGNLTGSQGDLCLNGDGSGNLFRCSSGTTWVSTI